MGTLACAWEVTGCGGGGRMWWGSVSAGRACQAGLAGDALARAIRERTCSWLNECMQSTVVVAAPMASPLPALVRLRAHARMVSEELRGLRREVRGLEQQREGSTEGRLLAWGRSGISRTAVMLYALHDYRSDCAVAWLAWQHEKKEGGGAGPRCLAEYCGGMVSGV